MRLWLLMALRRRLERKAINFIESSITMLKLVAPEQDQARQRAFCCPGFRRWVVALSSGSCLHD